MQACFMNSNDECVRINIHEYYGQQDYYCAIMCVLLMTGLNIMVRNLLIFKAYIMSCTVINLFVSSYSRHDDAEISASSDSIRLTLPGLLGISNVRLIIMVALNFPFPVLTCLWKHYTKRKCSRFDNFAICSADSPSLFCLVAQQSVSRFMSR